MRLPRVRWGSRPHALGGKLYEVGVGERVVFTWASSYDHVEDQESSDDFSVLAFVPSGRIEVSGYVFGLMARRDYVRLYVGAGRLSFDLEEPGFDFETLHPSDD